MTEEQRLRINCLELAIAASEHVHPFNRTNLAQEFYDFIVSKKNEPSLSEIIQRSNKHVTKPKTKK